MSNKAPAQSTDEGEQQRIYPMRLQRFLARAGVASRRGSENLMTAGRVCVNGVVVTELGSKVDPASDLVEVDGKQISLQEEPVYLMLHKPKGVLTTMNDPYGRTCVASYVPTQSYPGLFPIGRLDKDTTGLLLFTTDGDMAHALLHPSHHVLKHYLATLTEVPSEDALEALRAGITLEDGPCAPALIDEVIIGQESSYEGYVVGISIHEGRKRQVRRMFEALGYPVLELHRDMFAGIELGALEVGEYRLLDAEEIALLKGHSQPTNPS